MNKLAKFFKVISHIQTFLIFLFVSMLLIALGLSVDMAGEYLLASIIIFIWSIFLMKNILPAAYDMVNADGKILIVMFHGLFLIFAIAIGILISAIFMYGFSYNVIIGVFTGYFMHFGYLSVIILDYELEEPQEQTAVEPA